MLAPKPAAGLAAEKDASTVRRRLSATAHQVFEALKDDIVFGRLLPRQRLVELDLVSRFNCNRANIREALNELSKLGLIRYVANKGASVIDLTIEDIQEIYAVRIELEAMAAQWIKLPAALGVIDALNAIQRRHTEAVAKVDLPAIFAENDRFHEVLNNLAGNGHLARLINDMAFRALPIRYSAYMSQQYLNDVRDDHLDIIRALKGGRQDALAELIRKHNQRGLDWYQSQWLLRQR